MRMEEKRKNGDCTGCSTAVEGGTYWFESKSRKTAKNGKSKNVPAGCPPFLSNETLASSSFPKGNVAHLGWKEVMVQHWRNFLPLLLCLHTPLQTGMTVPFCHLKDFVFCWFWLDMSGLSWFNVHGYFLTWGRACLKQRKTETSWTWLYPCLEKPGQPSLG